MFCAIRIVWWRTQGGGSRFQVLRSLTHFRRYRGRQVPFSCFALPDSIWAAPRALGPVWMVCAPGPVLGGTEGVWSNFHVLRSRTRLGRYGGRRVPFSCFSFPDSFSMIQRMTGPVFVFCALRLILGGTEGVGSNFHVLRSRTLFRRNGRRYVLNSYFALSDPFWAVPRVSSLVFMFCAARFVWGGIKRVGSHFYVLRSRTHFQRYRWRRVLFFVFCALGLVFESTEGVGSHFNVLRFRTNFGTYRGRRVPFTSFALPDTF
jgi:hypothetical protein